MKKFNLYVVLLIILISCKQNNSNTNSKEHSINQQPIVEDNKKATDLLKNFYHTFYGVENPPRDEKIMKKYVSKRILDRIDSLTSDGENIILDYDPFIRGQDYSYQIIKKTLQVEQLENKNEYRVSFLRFGVKDEKRTIIDYLLKKNENGSFLIYSILNDNYLNFKNNKDLIKSSSLKDVLQKNISTPEKVIDNLVFTRDKNDSLQINTEILDYISKTTTRKNSTYLFALEDYINKYRNSEYWSIDEHSKIEGYIFNTTYPLRKKYWSDKFEEWYGGKPENLLGSGSIWKENNYYGLPKLEEYVNDFIVTHHWTQY